MPEPPEAEIIRSIIERRGPERSGTHPGPAAEGDGKRKGRTGAGGRAPAEGDPVSRGAQSEECRVKSASRQVYGN